LSHAPRFEASFFQAVNAKTPGSKDAKGREMERGSRRRRINAETQRFAEERRERGRKALFSSVFLRALCVSALNSLRFPG
jgi:hypothetical protein